MKRMTSDVLRDTSVLGDGRQWRTVVDDGGVPELRRVRERV